MFRRRASQGVELNVTAMLDMAFQLLAFFVLTFRPAALEPAVQLHMPPAEPLVRTGGESGKDHPLDRANIKLADIHALRINLFSTSGGLDRMTIDDFPAETFEALRNKMRTMLTDPATPIEQVVVRASEDLRYDEVMKVVAICLEQKLPKTGDFVKLNLVAMEDGRER